MIEHPDQFERLRADPTLMGTAVDEILRWSSPVLYHRRTVASPPRWAASPWTRTSRWPCSGPSPTATNAPSPDPDRFDVARTPNDHLAFGGGGPHYCLGANLAKREVRVMLTELLSRLDHVELDDGPGVEGERWSVPGLAVPVAIGLDRLPIRYQLQR